MVNMQAWIDPGLNEEDGKRDTDGKRTWEVGGEGKEVKRGADEVDEGEEKVEGGGDELDEDGRRTEAKPRPL